MKYVFFTLFLFAIPLLASENADSLLSKMERAMEPDNYVCKFKTKTAGSKIGEMRGNVYYKKGVGSLSEITYPPKSKGTKILLLKDRIWLRIPGASRPVPLSARGNFMGTALSNSDMMETSYTKDYKAQLLKDERVDGILCYRLDLKPRTRAAAYGRIKFWVRKDYTIPVKMEMYANSGRIYKVCGFDKIMRVAGRIRPTHYTIKNKIDNKKTEYWLLALRERNDISNTVFTKEHLMQ